MLLVVFAKVLNLASMVVIWALDQLVLALLLVLLDVLSEDAGAAFVVTFNDLEQTSLVMCSCILVHYDRVALGVGADYLPEGADLLVLFHVFPLDHCVATFFEETFAFVRAVELLKAAVNIQMMVHLAALDNFTALVAALKLSLLALLSYVVIHVVLDKFDSALKQAVDQPVGTCFIEMLLKILSNDLWADFIVWALYGCELAL